MQKLLITFLHLLVFSTSFGQTIQELEHDLSFWSAGSDEYGKIGKAKKLQELDPFNYQATEYICRYYIDRKIDSVSIYFDNLIKKQPNNTEPYLLRSELLFLEFDNQDRDFYNKQKNKNLSLALKINASDQSVIFKLAELYYKDFIYPLEKEKDWGFSIDWEDDLNDSTQIAREKPIKRSTFEHPADSSLNYFYQLWELRKDKREIIYFPIRQLECFLNQIYKSQIPKDFEKGINQCFFPSYYFTNLEEKWECDFTKDYLFEIESGKGTAEWLEVQLSNLKESCLFNKVNQPNSTIYRFTWLRSFHYPIAIRIERQDNKTLLFWKVGKGAGGYEPKGLKETGKKKLSHKEWERFEKLVVESNFDSLPNKNYVLMADGATWTLERKKSDLFKAHNTNSPSKEFKEACLYLLSLTNIKVKDDDKY